MSFLLLGHCPAVYPGTDCLPGSLAQRTFSSLKALRVHSGIPDCGSGGQSESCRWHIWGDLLAYSPHWVEGGGHEGLWPQQVPPRPWLSLSPQPWLRVPGLRGEDCVSRRDRSQAVLHTCGLTWLGLIWVNVMRCRRRYREGNQR